MVRIKMIDGIPCIVLDDGIIWSEKEIRQESRGYVMPEKIEKEVWRDLIKYK